MCSKSLMMARFQTHLKALCKIQQHQLRNRAVIYVAPKVRPYRPTQSTDCRVFAWRQTFLKQLSGLTCVNEVNVSRVTRLPVTFLLECMKVVDLIDVRAHDTVVVQQLIDGGYGLYSPQNDNPIQKAQ